MASDVKWIKITTDIFDDEKFLLIDSMPESDAIQLMWFKLLVFAGKSNNSGLFFFNDRIAYTDEMLASVFHRPINVVRLAMKTFVELGMIEEIDGIYSILNWGKYQNLDAYENKKLRDKEYSKKYREKQKLLASRINSDRKSSDESSDDSRFCSYSYSNSFNNNNLNTENLIYILSESEYCNKDYINNNTELLNSIKEWFDYKDNKKPKSSNHYSTELGMTKLLNKIVEADKKYGTAAVVSAIDNSIGNNYQGIVFDYISKGVTNNGCISRNAKDNYGYDDI